MLNSYRLLHRKWKWLFLAGFLFGLCIFLTKVPNDIDVHSQAEGRIYKVGIYDNPPKEYLNSLGQAKGLFPDVLNYIAEKENWKLQYILGNFNDDLASLQKGDIDILVDIDSQSPVRTAMFEFPKEAVINSWGIIYVRNGSPIQSFTDLDGKKIAVLQSNVYITGPEGILNYLSRFGVKAELVQVPVQKNAFDLLSEGKVDGALVDRIFAVGNQSKYPNIKATDLFFDPTTLSFAFRKGIPENKYLIERIDYWLGQLKNGDRNTYQQFLDSNGLSGLTTTHAVIPSWIYYAALGALALVAWMIIHIYFLRKARSLAYRRLEESQEYNKSLVEATDRSGIGMVVLQNVDGKEAAVVSANNMASKISGYSKDELLKMTLSDVLPIEILGKLLERYKARQEGKFEPYYYETEIIGKSGVKIPISVSPAVVMLNGKEATVIYFMDISEAKKTQELLFQSEERFRSIFEKSPFGIAIVDQDLKFINVNQKLCEMAGKSQNEFKNLKIEDITPPEFIEKNAMMAKELLEGKKNEFSSEEYYVHKNGEKVWSSISATVVKDSKGRFLYFLLMFDDITEKKKAEEKIIESEAKFRSVFEKGPLGVAILDHTMRFVSVNKTFANMMGISAKKIEKMGVQDLSSPDYHKRDRQAAKDLIEGKIGEFKTEEYRVKPNGEVNYHTITVRPVKDKNGNFLFFVAMFDDITKLKRTEEALKVSEKYYRHLVELSPDGIFIHSGGNMIYVNPAAEKLLGGKKEEIVGKPVLHFIDPSYRKAIATRINKLYKGEKVTTLIEERLMRVDRTSFDVEVSSAPILYKGRPAVQGVIRDITARKKAEDALKKNYSLLDSVVNSTADGLLVVDFDGRVEEYNEEFQKLWKVPEKLVRGKDDKKLLDYVMGELKDPKEFLRKVKYLYAHPAEESLDTIRFKDGRIIERYSRPQIMDGHTVGRVWSFRDITKREMAVAEVREDDARRKAIFESMEEGVLVVDLAGKVIMANRKGEQLLGWKSGEILGKDYRTFTLLDQVGKAVPRNKRPLAVTLRTGQPTVANDLYILINGEKIDLGLITSPIIVEGKMIGGMAVFRDIRKEKEVERAKSEFVSVASHQLRTPLGISKWYLEALKSGNLINKDPAAAARYVDVIEDDNERLIKLINDLLSVSRIEQLRVPDNPVTTNLSEITKDTVEKLKAIASKKEISLKITDYTDQKIKMNIDQERFREVLEVLVSNAIKYSFPKESIGISIKKVGENIKFGVTNRGIGISKSDRKKMFTKFFRSAEASRMDAEGTGLGLFVAKSYIEGWGGTIGFTSVPGKMTRFYFNLPIKGTK